MWPRLALNFSILLLHPPKCWYCRHVPSCLTFLIQVLNRRDGKTNNSRTVFLRRVEELREQNNYRLRYKYALFHLTETPSTVHL
jgi:hypothetical protein